MTDNVCFNCNKIIDPPDNSFTTGYGLDKDGNKFCYDCCAALTLAGMRESGRGILYLVEREMPDWKHFHKKYEVTDWPGCLVFPVTEYTVGRHNLAGSRIDVWFFDKSDPDNWQKWHGVNYGDNSQLLHCRRVKYTPRHLAY